MQWMVETLRHYPEIAIFLALALGFVIGPIKLGKFSLGNVTVVLLVGVLIGQLEITISSNVKSVRSSVVLMDGGGFGGPKWLIRISLANLNDGDYTRIGEYMLSAGQEYIAAWKAGK